MSLPLPCTTVATRLGVQSDVSRAQLAFTTLGTTTSSGNASAACAASSACAVLPRPGSSASRKVRCPASAAATTCAWCFISSSPPGTRSVVSSGSAMQAAAPSEARSKDSRSGSMSSQVARIVELGRRCSAPEKSGVRNGLDSWRERTAAGTTARSLTGRSSSSAGTSSVTSRPAAACISRLSSQAASETWASSARSASSEVSRAAVLARIVPMPSSRLSCSARCGSVRVVSVFTRAALLAGELGHHLELGARVGAAPGRAGRPTRPRARPARARG